MEFTSDTAARALVNLTERVEALEARIEEQDGIIEELRYAGPAPTRDFGGRVMYDEYEDLLTGEWDEL